MASVHGLLKKFWSLWCVLHTTGIFLLKLCRLAYFIRTSSKYVGPAVINLNKLIQIIITWDLIKQDQFQQFPGEYKLPNLGIININESIKELPLKSVSALIDSTQLVNSYYNWKLEFENWDIVSHVWWWVTTWLQGWMDENMRGGQGTGGGNGWPLVSVE